MEPDGFDEEKILPTGKGHGRLLDVSGSAPGPDVPPAGKKRRGRPKGSKNKPKLRAAPKNSSDSPENESNPGSEVRTIEEQEALAAFLQTHPEAGRLLDLQAQAMNEQLKTLLEQQAQAMTAAHQEELKALRETMLKQVEAAKEVVAPPPLPAPEQPMPLPPATPPGLKVPPGLEEEIRDIVRSELRNYPAPMRPAEPTLPTGDVYSRSPIAERLYPKYTPGYRR